MEIEEGYTELNKSVKEFFVEICLINNEIIKNYKEVYPFAFIIYDNNKIDIAKMFGDMKENQTELFKHISNKKIDGYIIVTELINQDNEKCYLRALYTPQEIFINIVSKKNNKLKERWVTNRKEMESDFWDFWGNFNTESCMKLK